MFKEEAIYDVKKSYLYNLEEGPFFSGEIPSFEEKEGALDFSLDFLGTQVRSRLGIFAGPLLNAKWVEAASKLGFDLLTYKTIRSKEFSGHSIPNICYVEAKEPFHPTHSPKTVRELPFCPPLDEMAITNSFGMPSRPFDYLKKDIPTATKKLKRGQALIVSFVGTPPNSIAPNSISKEDYFDDFLLAADVARESGGTLFEANFSCPNVSKEEGALYLDAEVSYLLAKRLVERLGHRPLIIKVGTFVNPLSLEKSLIALAKAGVRAISGINSYSMQVVGQDGLGSPLGQGRNFSGICGAPIRLLALDFIKQARKIIDDNKLDLLLLGGGGIVRKEHFDLFLTAGADFLFVATGWMWDPYLALRYKKIIQ